MGLDLIKQQESRYPMSLKPTIDQINQFRDERNWRPFHNAKDLAISISRRNCGCIDLYIDVIR
jgi:hypothetical protein